MSRWSLLPELTPFDRIALDAIATAEALPAGTVLIREGERPDAVFLLESGQVRVSMRRDGVDREVTLLAAPSLVGEMSFTSGDPASATVTVTEDSRFRRLARRSLEQRTAGDPGLGARFYRGLARLISDRLRGYTARWLGEDDHDDRDIERFVVRISSLHEEDLPAEAERWIVRYTQVGARPGYLWRWTWQGIRDISWDPAHEELAVTKLMLTILHALVADHLSADPASQAQTLAAAASGTTSISASPAASMIAELARAVDSRAAALPAGARLAGLLAFDRASALHALQYAALHQTYPALINVPELQQWSPYGDGLLASATLDAMGADLDDGALGVLREAINTIQAMQRLAQEAASWRREIVERRPTGLVLALGREAGAIRDDHSPAELLSRLEEAGIEGRLHELWRTHRRRLLALDGRHPAVDVARLARGAERLLGTTLATRVAP